MAKLTKVRTRKKPAETTIVEGDFSATRGGTYWFVKWPWGETHRVNAKMNQEQVRVLLMFARFAFDEGTARTIRRVHDALGLTPGTAAGQPAD